MSAGGHWTGRYCCHMTMNERRTDANESRRRRCGRMENMKRREKCVVGNRNKIKYWILPHTNTDRRRWGNERRRGGTWATTTTVKQRWNITTSIAKEWEDWMEKKELCGNNLNIWRDNQRGVCSGRTRSCAPSTTAYSAVFLHSVHSARPHQFELFGYFNATIESLRLRKGASSGSFSFYTIQPFFFVIFCFSFVFFSCSKHLSEWFPPVSVFRVEVENMWPRCAQRFQNFLIK